jgi:hypothetical protein
MGWKEERDALIAQTLAFVQSVTGKKDNMARSPAWTETVRDAVAEAPPERHAPRPIEPVKAPPPIQPAVVAAPAAEAAKIVEPAARSTPPPSSRHIVQSEVREEIRARIASFRAHQERFNREREEYFSATLARLRAAMKDSPSSRLRK